MADTTTEQPRLLEEIRREVVEARNMTIKTDNALKSLHAELKQVRDQQDAFQKRTWFSTGVVYIGVMALCAAGAVLISNARAATANADRERLEKQIGELTAQLDQQKGAIAQQQSSERSASEVYKMMTSLPGEERLKGIDALARLDQSKLSPFLKLVLADRAEVLKKDVGSAVLEKGRAAARRSDWPETIAQMNRLLTMKPTADDEAEACYFLGQAYLQTRKFDDSIKFLTRSIEGDKKAKNRDYAMLMLMQVYDAMGQRDKAVEMARDALNTYPSSDFRGQFFNRLQRRQEGQGQGGGAPATPAPAAGTTAQ